MVGREEAWQAVLTFAEAVMAAKESAEREREQDPDALPMRRRRLGRRRRAYVASMPHRCAVSRFWLTHARSTFPCLDEPHFRATFKLTIVRDRFHVSLTNMPIVATEEAGFYLGHRLLQDEFVVSPPMPPHMMAMAVCRLQRRAAPTASSETNSTELADDEEQPEISLYSDRQLILDESGPLLEWVQKTIQMFAFELNTSYPLPKFDIVVVEGGNPYSEGWGLITLSPATLSDTKTFARLLAQQWFGGLVSPRWWSSQWLMDALTSVLAERAPPYAGEPAERQQDSLLLDHILPALRLDSSSSVRAVASPRLERADIESATDELSLHKGAAIVSMAIEAAGEASGRAALARLLRDHTAASADARDLWRALERDGTNESSHAHAWDGWCERPGHPLLYATVVGKDVVLRQERFVMSADPPEADPPFINDLLTYDLRADLDELFYEPENLTDSEEDYNITTTPPPTQPPTTTHRPRSTHKWVIPVTFAVGPLEEEDVKLWRNGTDSVNGTWYDVGNDTKHAKVSRWAENVTHLIWMNDTEMTIPDLGKHKWVRYNVGARGLYRVAPQDPIDGESAEAVAAKAAELYDSGAPAERALMLDDAFVLSRARLIPASRAIAAATRLTTEYHWAPWRVVLSHLSWWRQLLRLWGSGARLTQLLATLHLTGHEVPADQLWLSGALLSAGVEWENKEVTKQALEMFDAWFHKNETIQEIYQEAALTAGVRTHGQPAWRACWSALRASYSAARPIYSHTALLTALASVQDDCLFYKFAFTALSSEAQRNREWKLWVTTLLASTCKWRGAAGVWRILRPKPVLPPSALLAAAKCLHQPQDYYNFKDQFGSVRGGQAALDTIALNIAWVARADADLQRYFNAMDKHNDHLH